MSDSTSDLTGLRRSALGPLARFGLVLLTWGLIGLAQPGVLRPDGFGHLAFFALGPWALGASRPGRRAFLAEWAGHSVGLALVFHWMLAFMPAILLPMSVVPALYPAFAGAILRRCTRWPLALLAPAAWMAAEVLRWCLPVPLSFGWFRLGMLMHDTEWIVGSAAWFGTWGLSYAMAALGGFAADLWLAATRPSGARYPVLSSVIFGLAPLVGLVVLSSSAGRAARLGRQPGPDVLIVQPGISQEIKASRQNQVEQRFVPQVTRTLKALFETAAGEAAERPSGGGPDPVPGRSQPDLVLWGETFLPGKLASDEVRGAVAQGAQPADWAWPHDQPLDMRVLEYQDTRARDVVAALFGKSRQRAYWQGAFQRGVGVDWTERVVNGQPLLPPGTSFLSGVEAWTVVEDGGEPALRSVNGVVLWDPEGRPSGVASKLHLVPGGETGEPLRRIPFVLDAVKKVASAIPDFVRTEEPSVLTLITPGGRAYRIGIAICFDNAFDDPFTDPLRGGEVDFFVVASNEAWFKDSALMDHMLAFTRIAAASTQRSIVRATNSGISCIVGPDGAVRELLDVPLDPSDPGAADGNRKRKMVAGALRGRVPVTRPAADAAPGQGTPRTFFVGAEPWLPWAFGGAGLLILGLCALISRPRPEGAP